VSGALSGRQWTGLGAVLALTVLAGALVLLDAPDVSVFALSAVALGGLAWVVSFTTESVGEHFSPTVTGLLQSTLGNLPELFIVLFALAAGEVVVAQFSILGSLFANALLVLGLVIVVGGARASDGVMRFRARLPRDTATLLLLAVFIIVLLGQSESAGDPASRHQLAISVAGALILLSVYAAFLLSYVRIPEPPVEVESAAMTTALPLPLAIGLLAVGGVGAALVSEWFVDSIDGAVDALGISRAFTGLVIVAIAGNAVEHVVGVVLAARGKSDLAISVVTNSVSQIAVFLFPALVLLSLFFEHRLTFVVAPVWVGALLLMALAVWQVTGDGEAAPFEGWALVGLYALLAVLAFYE
jgi:Ca2+:H+ antiporter